MNPKSFHKEQANLADQFVPFVVEGGVKKDDNSFQQSNVYPLKNKAFGLPDKFWEWVRNDSELSTALDQMIETRVQERVRGELEGFKAQVVVTAKKEGLEQGVKDSESELSEIKNTLSEMVEGVKREKEKLLREHAGIWVKVLKQVITLFFRQEPKLVTERLEKFFEEKIGDFKVQGMVDVQCSPQVYAQLNRLESPSPQLKIKLNPQLSGNAFHIEWQEGQILFDEEKALLSLNEIFSSLGA